MIGTKPPTHMTTGDSGQPHPRDIRMVRTFELGNIVFWPSIGTESRFVQLGGVNRRIAVYAPYPVSPECIKAQTWWRPSRTP